MPTLRFFLSFGCDRLKYTRCGLHTIAVGSYMDIGRRAASEWKSHNSLLRPDGIVVGIVAIIDLGGFGVASIAAHTTTICKPLQSGDRRNPLFGGADRLGHSWRFYPSV